MRWIDDITLLTQDFYASFGGSIHETPQGAGGIYRVTTSTWVIGKTANGKLGQNLEAYLAQCGNVRFQAAGSGNDLFYSQEVRKTDYNLLWEEPFYFNRFTFGQGEFWIGGTKHVTPDIKVKLCNSVIFGIYEDDQNRILQKRAEYKVTIYIHYET